MTNTNDNLTDDLPENQSKQKMKALIIGSGGREHAIVWKLSQSENIEKIWVAPGNGGTATENKSENVFMDVNPSSEEGQKILLEFAQKEKVDLTIVGPEDPLAAGFVDKFRSAGLAVIGPDKAASRLESSKVFSAKFMEKYGVRAGNRKVFTDIDKALEAVDKYFNRQNKSRALVKDDAVTALPLVIKADGLAAGKGVVITVDPKEAKDCIASFMKNGSIGEAGKTVIMEEYLEGREVSVMAAVSVKPGVKGVMRPFISARDHKRRFENDEGPNTGGMGAIAPVPDFDLKTQKDFIDAILNPTLKGMEAEKMDYRGFIFFGLMVKDGLCNLLEYNVRLGDPETQALLPLLDSDLSVMCLSILDSSLDSFAFKWKNKFSCAPVAVADGYPVSYGKGYPIAVNRNALDQKGAKLFIAGAQKGDGGASGDGLRTSGGRVLAVCALGDDGGDARARAYESLGFIGFEGMTYRKDIGLANNAGHCEGNNE